jgi:hypothetical protein
MSVDVADGDAARPAEPSWTGEWVAGRLGVELTDLDRPVGAGLGDLLGLAVRRNPRRAHLLVSAVLGKHVPTDPRLVRGAGLLLGELVRDALAAQAETAAPGRPGRPGGEHAGRLGAALTGALRGDPEAAAVLRDRLRATGPPLPAVVLGYAETATALGHCVADALGGAYYLHSTRRPVPGVTPYGGFEEEHSHATSHLLLPEAAARLDADVPVVLVDDEISTGTTVLNTIRSLHAVRPRRRYVVAALVDLRRPADHAAMARLAAELDARVETVALATGRVVLPDDVLSTAQRLIAALPGAAAEPAPSDPGARTTARPRLATGMVRRVDVGWPDGVPDGARHGFTPEHRRSLGSALPGMAGRLADALTDILGPVDGQPSRRGRPRNDDLAVVRGGRAARVLVLGFEELMYAPLRLAESLADRLGGAEVRYSTTTRSPVLPVDDPGYAIRTRLVFPAHDDPAEGPGERYAYNVAPGADPARRFDAITLVVDDAADTPELAGGLLARLAELGAPVLLVTVPSYRPAVGAGQARDPGGARSGTVGAAAGTPALPEPLYGPDFGSYPARDVAWLLTDLSHARLEAPTEEREEAIQAGRAHYAESLPVEYQPGADYQRLFQAALDASAARLAHGVGLITELILAERGRDAVLVSLARAGTPIGILVRRWAKFAHGLELPHYAISIVRGRGIDPVALHYLAARHDPARVMFVDGWTGKGAITRELTEAVAAHEAATGQGFPDDVAVVADPGRCVRIFGTRDDYLVPSACLNSTVSGLVSRTVLNDELIGPGDFHGAKFYAELGAADVSGRFLEAVCARFGEVADRVASDWPAVAGADRTPDWSGWAAVRRIGEEHGIANLNLIKPGVGETTRVLLRRVPWKILARADAGAELAHIRLLAEERGVPVVPVDPGTLPYACAGLIHPGYSRGGPR